MVYGGIFISVWYLSPTLEAVTELGRQQSQWIAELTSPAVAVSVVLPSVGMSLKKEARDEAANIRRKTVDVVKGSCMVIEGDGFWASIVRSALGAIEFMAKAGKMTSKVTRTTKDGFAWAAEQIDEDEAFAAAAVEAFAKARR